jgi:NAD(P)H-hydrate epimerase
MMQIEENGHQMGFSRKFMMENAGAASAKRLVENLDDVKDKSVLEKGLDRAKNVLVFAGLGNNGGDGLVIARHLAGYGLSVTVFLLGEPDNIRSEECSWNWNLLKKMKSVKSLTGVKLENFYDNFDSLEFDIIIDGILGTGISGEIREPQASAITFINKSNAYKLAVDVPSGVDPDTGNKNSPHVIADITVTFHRMKVGMPKAKDVCGEIFVEKIGIPPEAEDGVL